MFSGSWKESNMMEINLEIPDQNIDTEGWRATASAPFDLWPFPPLLLTKTAFSVCV